MKAAMTVNRAAHDHGVPPSTLKDRLSGKVKHAGHKPCPFCLDSQVFHTQNSVQIFVQHINHFLHIMVN